ncbi:hypothetical protein Ngar_c04650 [Candidatus Nitrososphaera gargensis Ga9.2]|uniref:Uncharacterized protein n=1 Tax=Nitrososphaera gargensis (strain Ga9.2) TaxID=1237085 RepID=K0ILW9_NITGG|nr:hypothetical protein Ngar_c04650 [Candidatus Nitrososphaera gargensis Ga9.2]
MLVQINPFLLLKPYGSAYYADGLQPAHALNQGYSVPIDIMIVNSPTQKVPTLSRNFGSWLTMPTGFGIRPV